jgi:sugar phosphate isomerase/epimerase
LPLDEVGALLRRHDVPAVQLRCAADEPVHVGLAPAARRAARQTLADEGLILIGLATYVKLADGAPGFDEHLQLAHDLGATAMRLMPGGSEPPGGRTVGSPAFDQATHPSQAVLERAAETLARIAQRAAGSGVRLLVETHDAFLRGADLRRLLTLAQAGPSVGAIWDALHPWRAGEAPDVTAAALGPWLSEVQIKDVAAPDQLRPLVPGTGSVPLAGVLAAARGAGFDGPVVLEHEARWYADAAPIDATIDGAWRVLAAAGGTA